MARSRSTRPRWGALAPVVITALLAVAGCASLGGGGTTPGGGTGSGGADGADDGRGGGDGAGGDGTGDVPGESAPVLQISHAGGFVPRGWDFRAVPDLTLYADGTAISHGPQIMIYPGPALPALVMTQLDAADVDVVVDAARGAGLLEDAPDYGQPQITDMPTTFVTLRVDGAEHRHSAYALGAGDDAVHEEDAAAARAALTGFLEEVRALVDPIEGEPFAPDRFAVLADPLADDAMQVEEGIDREVRAWPVDGVALADATECVTVDGEAGAALGAALAGANQLTAFEDDGVPYEVHARALLPHEAGCADLDV